MIRKFSMSAVLALAAFNFACETSEDNAILKGQACLDKATTASQGTTCLRTVNGISSDKASRIRCAAIFIQRNISKSTFTQAFQSLKNASGGQDPVFSMLGVLAFVGNNSETGSSALDDASFAMSECASGKSPGMTYFAMITSTATLASTIAGITSGVPDTAQLQSGLTAIQNGTATAAQLTQMGTAVITGYNSYCAVGTQADPKMCADVKTSIDQSGGNPTEVAKKFAELVKT
jgi:hypothetical protein